MLLVVLWVLWGVGISLHQPFAENCSVHQREAFSSDLTRQGLSQPDPYLVWQAPQYLPLCGL